MEKVTKITEVSQELTYNEVSKMLKCGRGKAQNIMTEIKEKYNIPKGVKITLYQFLDYQGLSFLLD